MQQKLCGGTEYDLAAALPYGAVFLPCAQQAAYGKGSEIHCVSRFFIRGFNFKPVSRSCGRLFPPSTPARGQAFVRPTGRSAPHDPPDTRPDIWPATAPWLTTADPFKYCLIFAAAGFTNPGIPGDSGLWIAVNSSRSSRVFRGVPSTPAGRQTPGPPWLPGCSVRVRSQPWVSLHTPQRPARDRRARIPAPSGW